MRIVTIRAEVSNDTAAFFDAAGKEKQVRKELKNAVNDMAKKLKKDIHQKVKEDYTIKAGKFRKSDITLKSARETNLSAKISISGGPISLVGGFRTRSNGLRKAGQAQIKKEGGLKELKKDRTLKAFIATVTKEQDKDEEEKTTYTNLFQRKGKSRYPLKSFHGPGRAKISEVVFRELKEEKENELSERLTALAERLMR